ncbi:unnamed protein product [Paramecium pentaurelia]|uniref:Uncharacterized protein n=1 Tax=Paramecium pentaurelia TaxID=43138 RepID=A0A8S1SQ19_9CILI|nr:unnamed protein product [Paramecium pentaurelia]
MKITIILLLYIVSLTYCQQNDEILGFMYVFAQEWPGSICKFVNCTKTYMGNYDNARWNTHGLWPNTMLETTCGMIFNCKDEEYDEDKLTIATKTLIDVTWNGMYADTFTFRKHEWEKHGTCHPDNLTQNGYMSRVGNLNNQYNYYKILASAGIYPDDNRQLTDSEVRAAFTKVLGISTAMTYTCQKDPTTGKFYIAELRTCFTQAMKPRTCDCSKPISAFVTCGKTFYYPTFLLSVNEQIEYEEIPDLSNSFLE